MSKGIAIHWFRQDLRITDNPSLEAATEFDAVLPIFILDDENSKGYELVSHGFERKLGLENIS